MPTFPKTLLIYRVLHFCLAHIPFRPTAYVGVFLVLAPLCALHSQNRDLRAERIIVDDNGSDGTANTITLQTSGSLSQNVTLTIPDPGSDSALLLLAPAGSSGPWLLGGNSGTTAGTDFFGTTDATALHLYVNNGNDNALILNPNGSVQRDLGGNSRGNNAVDLQVVRDDPTKIAAGVSSVVAGGERNRASSNRATVSGGFGNIASDVDATVSGGTLNTASEWGSTVSGGQRNTASGFISNVSGGARNTVDGQYGAILGGRGLTLNGEGSFGYLGNNFTGSGNGSQRMVVDSANVGVFGNTDIWLANNDGEASRLLFFEPNSTVGSFPTDTTFYTSIQAGDQSANINYVLPTSPPTTNGQMLASDTNGVMSWVDGPTGAQAFTNASNGASTLTLGNSSTGDDGTALEITEGRMVLSTAQGAPAAIPDDVVAFDIDDATGASAPTVGLPAAGIDGQILYVLVSDPDGATVGGAAWASGDKLTYLYLGGAWQLFHVN